MASYLPLANLLGLNFESKQAGATKSPRYCYSVWLRHMVMAHENGFTAWPKSIAEIGPGDTLGVGLAALISGAEEYYACDVVKHAHNVDDNLELLAGVISLFGSRAPIPGEEEFPDLYPRLMSYKFPDHIFTAARMCESLKNDRINSIRSEIAKIDKNFSEGREGRVKIRYVVPWYGSDVIQRGQLDMIFSQAVMEHVDDMVLAYGIMYAYLKSGGFVSHEIDFQSHGTALVWNGHWGYSDLLWKIIKGRMPYLINRYTHSQHLDVIKRAGFKIIIDITSKRTGGIDRQLCATQFKNMSDEDMVTSSAFIQAAK